MKVFVPGHLYELDSFDGGAPQQLQFIHKEPSASIPNTLYTVYDGTTNEEVMRMLIDRLNFLNNKFPCRENSLAITSLQVALFWLEERTKNRISRDVEGKHKA